tara:strand:- start:2814 stop:3311 length:498 start_codon:yes stop_codon:yes gene_type:complete
MALHKRSASRRSNDFLAPRVQCFACYDTGIVSNSDGLVWNYVPDYDIDLNTGKRCGGLDLAIVCHCTAAYESQDFQTNVTRSGYRTSDAVKSVETNGYNQQLGILISKEHTREIHRARRASWEITCRNMEELRKNATAGTKPQLPAYIENVRAQLLDAKNLLPAV